MIREEAITVEKAYKIAKTVKETCIKLDAKCDSKCPFADGAFCRMAVVSGEGTPSQWEFPSCKSQDEHMDEPKVDEGIISRIEALERKVDDLDFTLDKTLDENTVETDGGRIAALERQVDALEGVVKSQDTFIDNFTKHLNELHSRVYTLEKWRRS